MMPTHPTDLLEAYALHLLSPATEAEIAAHLTTCDACQAAVTSLDKTLGALAYAAPAQVASAAVEDRLFAQIAALRDQEQRHADVPEKLAPPSRVGKLSATTATTGASGHIVPWRSRRWPTTLSAVAALVAVILVAVLLTQHGSSPPLSLTARATQALHATNPSTFTLQATKVGPKGAAAAMAMDPTRGRGVLVVAHLPPSPAGKTYEFWLVQSAGVDKPSTIMPSGTFGVQADGSDEYFFTSNQPIDTLMNAGVSLERTGGVSSPDAPMLLLINE